ITLSLPTADPITIRRAAQECLRRVPLKQKLRLLGVRASALSSNNGISEHNDKSHQRELPLTVLSVEQ
ncbi:MAG: DNA polymerase IV, partial [Pseudomonadota bacterium]|nr:DNA polymerase IV [Pseudomonadota bacterium]